MYDVPDYLSRDVVKATYAEFPGEVVCFLLEDGKTVLFIGKDGDILAEHISGYDTLPARFPDGEPTRVRVTNMDILNEGIAPTLAAVEISVVLIIRIDEEQEDES